MEKREKTENRQEIQLVAFNLENEEYAVDILSVQEIIRWTTVTRVPGAPQSIKGVINLRGAVIPVIDTHFRFNLKPEEISEATRIIVFKLDEGPIGMMVDQVTEVLSLPEAQIEKPQTINGSENQYVKGIGKIGDRLLLILDLAKVLGEMR